MDPSGDWEPWQGGRERVKEGAIRKKNVARARLQKVWKGERGTARRVKSRARRQLGQVTQEQVIDAHGKYREGALTAILSPNKTNLQSNPSACILTDHPHQMCAEWMERRHSTYGNLPTHGGHHHAESTMGITHRPLSKSLL